MSRIAAARTAAAEIIALTARMTLEQSNELARDCPLGFGLADLVDGRFVAQVEERGLDLLARCLERARQIAARDDKTSAKFAVGDEVVVQHEGWSVVVKGTVANRVYRDEPDMGLVGWIYTVKGKGMSYAVWENQFGWRIEDGFSYNGSNDLFWS